jgi:hypothetical protein
MAKTVSAEEMRKPGNGWVKIWLRRGVPVSYGEQLVFANPVYMCQIQGDEMALARKDPEVPKDDADALSIRMLTSCLAGVADETYSREEADKNVAASRILDAERKAFVPSDGISTFPKTAKDAVVGTLLHKGDDHVLRFLMRDLERPEILFADRTRLTKAFSSLNMLEDEDLDSFFDALNA